MIRIPLHCHLAFNFAIIGKILHGNFVFDFGIFFTNCKNMPNLHPAQNIPQYGVLLVWMIISYCYENPLE